MKKILAIVACTASLFVVVEGFGQQLPMYGQYIFNNTILNPAQAGSSSCHEIGILGRHQWIGFEGAPRTYSMYANFRLPSNLGIAGGIYQDNIGRIKDLTLQGDIAYHLRVSSSWRFAVGVRAQASHTLVDLTDFVFSDPTDPWYGKDFGSKLLFNTGIGFLMYDSKTFVGISVPKLLRNSLANGTSVGELANEFHLFAYGGTTFQLTDLMVATPSFLFKHANKSPMQMDFNLVFGYQEFLDFGGLVRSDLYNNRLDAIGLLVGINLGGPWYFGYKYEYPMNDINLVSTQVHEVSLKYQWCGGRRKLIASPRYFL